MAIVWGVPNFRIFTVDIKLFQSFISVCCRIMLFYVIYFFRFVYVCVSVISEYLRTNVVNST